MPKRKKNWLLFAVKFVFSFAIIAYLLLELTPIRDIGNAIRGVDIFWLALSFCELSKCAPCSNLRSDAFTSSAVAGRLSGSGSRQRTMISSSGWGNFGRISDGSRKRPIGLIPVKSS